MVLLVLSLVLLAVSCHTSTGAEDFPDPPVLQRHTRHTRLGQAPEVVARPPLYTLQDLEKDVEAGTFTCDGSIRPRVELLLWELNDSLEDLAEEDKFDSYRLYRQAMHICHPESYPRD